MTADPHRRALRARLRRERRALAPAQRIAAAETLAHVLAALPALDEPGYVAGYWAVDGELSLHALLADPTRPFVYCLPCLRADNSLGFAPWRAGDPLVQNRFGIPEPDVAPTSQLEPSELAVALVPLLGFDRAGNRIGSGAGYYDRSFAFLRDRARPAQPLLVGVGYSQQEVDGIEAATWDVPLDLVATERELIACSAG